MSGLTMPWQSFRNFLGELVGVRVGLGLDEQQLDGFLDADAHGKPESGTYVRMNPLDFEGAVFTAMAACGDRWTDMGPVPRGQALIALEHNFTAYAQALELIHRQLHQQGLGREYSHHTDECYVAEEPADFRVSGFMDMYALNADLSEFDTAPLLGEADIRGGATTRRACELVLHAYRCEQRLNPWRVRTEQVESLLELRELFDAARAPHEPAAFFDQRFIDFLYANLDALPRVHWRQFERLVAEYLRRQGYEVQLGPGGNDDGVDVRMWPTDADRAGPPLLIVQCKRQRTKVEKIVVKGLWADMQAEAAVRGLVATTSTLAPGAAKTISARGYGIDVADGAAIAQWLEVMRTPGVGPSIG